MTEDKKSARQDVLAFLDDLDIDAKPVPSSGGGNDTPVSGTTPSGGGGGGGGVGGGPVSAGAVTAGENQGEDAQSVLDFLDEITQKRSSTPSAGANTQIKRAPAGGIKREDSKASLRAGGSGTSNVGRKSGDSARSYRSSLERDRGSPSIPPTDTSTPPSSGVEKPDSSSSGGGGWGWSSVWSSATSVIQQAQKVVEDGSAAGLATTGKGMSGVAGLVKGVREGLENNEQAKKWTGGVMEMVKNVQNTGGLDKISHDIKAFSGRTLQEILNAVAPPIAEHEIIEVSLSHDMVGYDGVESLVYRAMAKIMEQVEGGDLVVNRGREEKPKEDREKNDQNEEEERNLNYVEGLEEAYKLAEANISSLIKTSYKPPEPASSSDPSVPTSSSPSEEPNSPSRQQHQRSKSVTVPITICPVYMRIQPCLSPLPLFGSSSTTSPSTAPTTSAPQTQIQSVKEKQEKAKEEQQPLRLAVPVEKEKHLFFVMILKDPTNSLSHTTLTQSLPGSWLDIPFEENEWVEDVMVDIIRRGVEVLGQQYISGRMSGKALKNVPATSSSVENEKDTNKDTKDNDGNLTAAMTTSPAT